MSAWRACAASVAPLVPVSSLATRARCSRLGLSLSLLSYERALILCSARSLRVSTGAKVIQMKAHNVVPGEEAGAMCWVCNKCLLEKSLHLPPSTPMRQAPKKEDAYADAALVATMNRLNDEKLSSPTPPAKGSPAIPRPHAGSNAPPPVRNALPTSSPPSQRETAYGEGPPEVTHNVTCASG